MRVKTVLSAAILTAIIAPARLQASCKTDVKPLPEGAGYEQKISGSTVTYTFPDKDRLLEFYNSRGLQLATLAEAGCSEVKYIVGGEVFGRVALPKPKLAKQASASPQPKWVGPVLRPTAADTYHKAEEEFRRRQEAGDDNENEIEEPTDENLNSLLDFDIGFDRRMAASIEKLEIWYETDSEHPDAVALREDVCGNKAQFSEHLQHLAAVLDAKNRDSDRAKEARQIVIHSTELTGKLEREQDLRQQIFSGFKQLEGMGVNCE
ncbi:MAG TPA: hypothetical protein VG206_23195 [Terriglobia bacterium]|nr:hypothetical protein [Terriglobia bacterium]